MRYLSKYKLFMGLCCAAVFFCLPAQKVHPRVSFQFLPTLTISEEYSDNYLETSSNHVEEYITKYAAGFSLGMIEQKFKFYLDYAPEYRDYDELNERDRLVHPVSFQGQWTPTRRTEMQLRASYNGSNENYQSETERNIVHFDGMTQLDKSLEFLYGHTYEDAFERQTRTGVFTDHTVNSGFLELAKQYGAKNGLSGKLDYAVDSYDSDDDDSYTEIRPSARLTHWMTPMTGLDTGLSFKYKDFDDRGGDEQSVSGDIRYIKVMARNFDLYAKYRHSYAETDTYEHHIFHPSVGFDYAMDETSGISLGVGVLFHDWSNDNDDDPDLFLDIDAYKRFDFSPRMQLDLTGSSTYSESSEDASSLGYNTNYRVGARFRYALTKQVFSNIFGSYQLTQYDETSQNRQDENLSVGAGLSWNPLKWLEVDLQYRYKDFSTDSAVRDDYDQNIAMLTIRLIPETPVRFDSPVSRRQFEKLIFD